MPFQFFLPYRIRHKRVPNRFIVELQAKLIRNKKFYLSVHSIFDEGHGILVRLCMMFFYCAFNVTILDTLVYKIVVSLDVRWSASGE